MATLNRKAQASRWRDLRFWRWSQLVGGVLLGCALTLLVPWLTKTLSNLPSREGTSRLVGKLGAARLTLGRLASQTAYAHYPTPIDRQTQQEFARLCRMLPTPVTSPTSSDLHDRALCALAGKNIDAAAADLEEAVHLAPGNATLLSDLSALYGERAAVEDHPEDYAAALEMAERAVAIAPKLPEAVFNRATALEHLFLYSEARVSWQRYLEIDGKSRWTEEVQLHFSIASMRRQHDGNLAHLLNLPLYFISPVVVHYLQGGFS